MKITRHSEDEKLHFFCSGKIKSSQEFLKVKKIFAKAIKEPEQNLVITLDTFPIDSNFIGLLLHYSNQKNHKIQILVTNYSCFRMLEDLYLLEKFDAKYQKEK